MTLPAGAAGGGADVTGADAVAEAMGAEGVVSGVSGMLGVTEPVAVPGPVATATAATPDEVAGAAAGEDAAGGLVGTGALAEGGGTDGTLPPAAPRPNWVFWQVPEHFWYKERRFPAPHSSALLPLHAMVQVPTIPGVGCARAGRESPQKHCEAYSSPAME